MLGDVMEMKIPHLGRALTTVPGQCVAKSGMTKVEKLIDSNIISEES